MLERRTSHPYRVIAGLTAAWTAWGPVPLALATQGHGAPEGLYVHQFAHTFFLISMGILIFWLRQRRLVRRTGWRYIQYAALCFILWNVATILLHFLEEQTTLLAITRIGAWRMAISTPEGYRGLVGLYYAAKLDHLLCVPALLFLYFGLKRLLHQTGPSIPKG
jgi:hypothetical protein